MTDTENNLPQTDSSRHEYLRQKFLIRKHPKAPLFEVESNPQLIVEQLIGELESGTRMHATDKLREMFRQAGFVNLYFFLKVIAGSSGPYGALTSTLHREMCNYRQSDYCMGAGEYSAFILGRGMYKSTVGGHGADIWEIVRWPEIRIILMNAIADKAHEFAGNIMGVLKGGGLFKWLYPEYIIPQRQAEIRVPCQSTRPTEPNVKVIGAGGAIAGNHCDLGDIDDIVSEQDLDVEGRGGTEMEKKKRMFRLIPGSILDDKSAGRLCAKFTRYAPDDPYQDVVEDIKSLAGYQDIDLKVKPNGKWNVYYRLPIENGEVTFKEHFTKEWYEKLQKDDPWQYYTQHCNKAEDSGLAEFRRMGVGGATCWFDEDTGEWWLQRVQEDNFPVPGKYEGYWDPFPLSECYCLMAVDPASTNTGITAKTCRSAVLIWAAHHSGDKFLIFSRVGYFSVVETFDKIFEGFMLFEGYVGTCKYETNAMQKGYLDMLRNEATEREIPAYFDGTHQTGDKFARIRTTVGKELLKKQVWLCVGHGAEFMEEKDLFPMSKYKIDTLDATEQAFSSFPMMQDPDVMVDEDALEEERIADMDPVIGW